MKKSSEVNEAKEPWNEDSSMSNVLFRRDHKRIALLYLASVTLFFLIGGGLSFLMRAEVASPGTALFSDSLYNSLFSLHGIFMVFFFLIPAIPAVLGNLLIPLSIGSRDLAFPRLNLLSWYLFALGGLTVLWATFKGGTATTWTFVEPLTSNEGGGASALILLGIGLASVSVIMLSINFLASIHLLRSKRLPWMELPLFTWAIYCCSLIILVATPLLLALIFILSSDLTFGTRFFDPSSGGDPLLYRRLFWLYARPMFFAVILPVLGLISEVLSANRTAPRSRGYELSLFSMFSIVVLGFLTAGVHLLVVDDSGYSALITTFMAFLSTLPFVVIVGYWLSLMTRGPIPKGPATLFVLGSLLLFLTGGLTGLFLAAAGGNIHLHSTLFVVAHFHYFLAGGVVLSYLGGVHRWWEELSGKQFNKSWAVVSPVILFVGLNLTFFPLLLLGFMGMPRRFHQYPAEFEVYQVLASAGMTILFLGYLLPIFYLGWSFLSSERNCLDLETGDKEGEELSAC